MQIGDTYLWRDGGHLWVVISDPNLHGGEFIAVNLTKDVFRAGKECELNIGDHRWIKEKTYVSFGDAMKIGPRETANLEKHIASGAIQRHLPMKGSVLQKIIAVAKKTTAIAPEFVDYL